LSDSDIAAASPSNPIGLTASIVAAYLGHNTVPVDALPDLIRSVHASLTGLNAPAPVPEPRPQPAVPVKKSVFPDFLICLEDGKRLKMLKRHLKTAYNMTADEYRARWNLPADYPMVAPNYARQRSTLAKSIALGRPKIPVPTEVPPPAPVRAKGGRKKATA
jgi:predicted transcriptional regulator